MKMHTMTKLTAMQMETICGGSNYTWRCNYKGPHSGGGSSSTSSGPTYIHFGDSMNNSSIDVHDINLTNSFLAVIINQYGY